MSAPNNTQERPDYEAGIQRWREARFDNVADQLQELCDALDASEARCAALAKALERIVNDSRNTSPYAREIAREALAAAALEASL